MRYILHCLQLTFLIYLVWNMRLLIFLAMPQIPHYHGFWLSRCRLNHKSKYTGMIIGSMQNYGNKTIRFSDITLNNDIVLQIKPSTCVILDGDSYGEQVCVYGKVQIIRNQFVMCPTSIVCTRKKRVIKRELNKRLTVSTIIAIILEVILWYISTNQMMINMISLL